ncbi:MAG: dephospho-CoA kinase [Pirellulaceae bacterium]
MIVVGLAGGVASGKSLAADLLRELGAVVLDGDGAGHEVLREPEVIAALREQFGDGVVLSDGEIDRRAVARIVFADNAEGREKLKILEQITHPRIGARLQAEMERLRQQDVPMVVLDAALMFKAGWNRYCDHVLFVDSPRETRLRRSLQRGWSEADFAAREAAQLPVEEKRRRADVVFDNSGSPEQLRRQVEGFWESLNLG